MCCADKLALQEKPEEAFKRHTYSSNKISKQGHGRVKRVQDEGEFRLWFVWCNSWQVQLNRQLCSWLRDERK